MMTINKMKKLGIYIHIPFCLSKCLYCGFYSRGGSTEKEQEDYIENLLGDIEAYGDTYGDRYAVDSIFIGGGTPSILGQGLIEKVLGAVKDFFSVEEDAEITIEANPKTLTRDKLIAYMRCGINRLSLGAQSLDDGLLQFMGRAHTAEDFLQNFQMARDCGFDNINVDLMFSIPGHTMEIWEDTLSRIIDLEPEHISFYSLQLEEGTPFYTMFCRGELEEVSDEEDRRMYHRAVSMVRQAGYDHYEISNAARPGSQCRHNLKYWSLEDYLGIGSGASSYMEGVRFTEAPFMEFHQNTLSDDMGEFVFTGLRRTCGIDLNQFADRFGREFWTVYGDRREELAAFFERGQLIEEKGRLRLSEEGIDISNGIMAVFV